MLTCHAYTPQCNHDAKVSRHWEPLNQDAMDRLEDEKRNVEERGQVRVFRSGHSGVFCETHDVCVVDW